MIHEGYEPIYFLRMMFDGFTRVLFIDTGVGNISESESRSNELACMLCMRHERRKGTLKAIEDAIQRKRNWPDRGRPHDELLLNDMGDLFPERLFTSCMI